MSYEDLRDKQLNQEVIEDCYKKLKDFPQDKYLLKTLEIAKENLNTIKRKYS